MGSAQESTDPLTLPGVGEAADFLWDHADRFIEIPSSTKRPEPEAQSAFGHVIKQIATKVKAALLEDPPKWARTAYKSNKMRKLF